MPHDYLAGYRADLARHGLTWGEPPLAYVRVMSPSRFIDDGTFHAAALERARAQAPDASEAELEILLRELNFDEVLLEVIGDDPPDGLAILRLTPAGDVLLGRTRAVLDRPLPLTLLIDNRRGPATLSIGGRSVKVEAGGVRVVELDTAAEVTGVDLTGLTRAARPARLRLRAGMPCRWSVWTADGQGWYPRDAPARCDYHGTPFFHGDDLVLDVPAEPLTVRVTRGMEYDMAETALTPSGDTLVQLTPGRRYDAAAHGWYGGDLHVHLNFTGDLVATPDMAAAMQLGEDLHVLNLVAANVSGERIMDREALEAWAGRDLPWSDATHVARMGVEYRDDLLGHIIGFGPAAPPTRYHAGFLGAPDWPPVTRACRELRELGAVVTYAHAFHAPVHGAADVIGSGRPQCTARMAVVDAALGLADGLEVLHFSSAAGSSAVYRRLVGAGNRLAALAGTDTMVSFTRQRMEMVSSPIGFERTYARVTGPLTAAPFAEAVRAGRTFATTGPFVELTVDGAGPGETVSCSHGTVLRVEVRVTGVEAERVTVLAGDTAVAMRGGVGEVSATESTYVVAVVEGGPHPRSLFTNVFAHTSAIYVEVDRRPVARRADVEFCLDWLARLAALIEDKARLPEAGQLTDYLDLIAEARAVYRERLTW
ncbi:hypothetical protein Acor_65220 [Acrocarpospora corrugata]|uniref:Uncharacterized protein n=1 Tax=Acrocarpospora corrugata TaxID=35763 RepID=A0A5M3W6M0_9ACTN|nr:CehA/McbA family metallohydrolase [Acrocarpospora corrugata]GES04454.1 hypothetical protein Acor_65220 [Acrocarpospora corrugata]